MTEPATPQPSTEIAVRKPAMALADKIRYAQTLADSGLLPKQYQKQPANILFATEYADMLDLAPMAAITGIHVIEGKPTASAGLIGALVRRAGHRLRVTGNDTKAVAEIVRCDDPDFTFRSEWTIERAKKAELTGKSNWKKYPAAMLKARAITEVARDACEEALSGMHYTPEELGAEVNEEGEPITVDAEVVEDTPATDWEALIGRAAGDADALRELYMQARRAEPTNKALLDRIAAAGKAAKDAAEQPVEAEIVEEPSVPDLVVRVLTVESVIDADRLCGEVSQSGAGGVDVTDQLTADDREALDIDETTTITLSTLASEVAARVGKYKVPVRFTDDLAEPAAA